MSIQNTFNAGFNLFKQKTLHMVSKVVDLDKVGLDKHVAIEDPMFQALYANVMKLQTVLRAMLKSVEEFEKVIDAQHKMSLDLCDAMSSFSGPDDQYKVSRMTSPYRQTVNYLCVNGLGHTCRGEAQKLLQERVKNIIEQNLALIKDIRDRVQLRGIATYELQTLQTSLDRKLSFSKEKSTSSDGSSNEADDNSTSITKLEDQIADKERSYNQMNAGLFQQLTAVNEQRFELVAKLFQAFKECQLFFYKSATTAMEENCIESGPAVEEISNMACPVLSSEMRVEKSDDTKPAEQETSNKSEVIKTELPEKVEEESTEDEVEDDKAKIDNVNEAQEAAEKDLNSEETVNAKEIEVDVPKADTSKETE
eukprot:g2817.t1